MSRKTKFERQIIKRLKAMTDQFTIQHTRNGHLKVVFEGARKASVIFGCSPSDHRTVENCFACAKRAIVEAGIEPKEA